MNKISHRCFALWIFLLLFPAGRTDAAPPSSFQRITLMRPISSSDYPVVIPGRELPPLLDHPIAQITLFAVHGGRLQPIPFQIDRRDRRGRFQLPSGKKRREGRFPFDGNDECVFMDIRIHIPFKIGLFFSDVETLMTIDGNETSRLPPTYVFSPSMHTGSLIDGKMSDREKKINTSGDRALAIVSSYGTILIGLQLAENLPLNNRVYLVDDKGQRDPPEHIPGQYGNVGFLTEGWETLKGAFYHMSFTIYMTEEQSAEKGFELLHNAPNLMEDGPAFP